MCATEPSCSYWEPLELRKLKQKLAQLSCKCITCNKSKTPYCSVISFAENDKQVQVQEPRAGSFNQFTQVNPDTMVTDHHHFLNTITKDVLCPSCFITMNLLRGGVLKVLKDEESEAKPEMFRCDKSIGKCKKVIEKSTSITKKSVSNLSNLTLCDFISDCSSDQSVPLPVHEQKRSHQVKFKGDAADERKETPLKGACLCLENFIDSIRPPFVDVSYMK